MGSLPSGTLTLTLGLGLGVAACVAALITTKSNPDTSRKEGVFSQKTPELTPTTVIPSPLKTHLPHLTTPEIAALPYPPDLLPGARSVDTPYGTVRAFEWGPHGGEKVVLLHGISTPCPALAGLAHALVDRHGCRVLVFDLFGRGYSDAPVPHANSGTGGKGGGGVVYDAGLYAAQILMVVASSEVGGWMPAGGDDGQHGGEMCGFHLIGYSLGGAIAVSFARYFGRMVKSVVVVAGAGLVRYQAHVGWASRVLYSTRGWGCFEGLREWLVRRRLTPRAANGTATTTSTATTTETSMAGELVVEAKRREDSDASGGHSFDNAVLLPGRPQLTVSSVMDWQLRHHRGFVPAFISSIRHAPIYDQHEHWRALGRLLAERRDDDNPGQRRRPGLAGGKILLVLGASDPVIVKDELLQDAAAVLGEDGFEAAVLDAGHELVMTKAPEIADLAVGFWTRMGAGKGRVCRGRERLTAG